MARCEDNDKQLRPYRSQRTIDNGGTYEEVFPRNLLCRQPIIANSMVGCAMLRHSAMRCFLPEEESGDGR
jgi:hypothetical protein